MDSASFKGFYEAYVDKIHRFVIVRVGDRELAEDLVSEIFLKALRAFESYDEAISRSSWIYTITRNHLANYYRSAGRTVSDDAIEELPSLDPSLPEKLALKGEVERLFQALTSLPPEKQALIRMKYLEERTYDEMALALGKAPGALKVATFRAMNELRQRMSEQAVRPVVSSSLE